MCLYPKLIMNRKYVANKKNGGIIPPIYDKRVLQVPVGCGKCMECKKQKAREWAVRLHEEIRNDNKCTFVTLSFSDESLIKLESEIKGLEGYDLDNATAKKACRKFLERWRKKYKKSVKHWFVTEIGGNYTERIHLHGLIWTDEEKIKELENIWQYGHVYKGEYVNEKTINYIVKYVNKVDQKHKEYNSKILTSAGIGKSYMERIDAENNKYKGDKTKEVYKMRNGVKLALPIYYRNKIYSEEEREKLWLQKLDKGEIYVLGNKINVQENPDEYYNALKYYREKNKRLGYGDDSKNWDLKRYENNIRNQKKKERIRKNNKKANG